MDQFNMMEALHAKGPANDLALNLMLYGQFVGSWEGRLVVYESEDRKHEVPMEVHFDWVLEGKAVQDVWIAPSRKFRHIPEMRKKVNFYGTTLRVYDPKEDIWHITYINPASQTTVKMTGRRIGDDIVQECKTGEDILEQWIYTDITDNSFHWIARESSDGGKTWRLEQEFFLERCSTK